MFTVIMFPFFNWIVESATWIGVVLFIWSYLPSVFQHLASFFSTYRRNTRATTPQEQVRIRQPQRRAAYLRELSNERAASHPPRYRVGRSIPSLVAIPSQYRSRQYRRRSNARASSEEVFGHAGSNLNPDLVPGPEASEPSVQRQPVSETSDQRPTESKASVQRPTESKASVQQPTETKASVQRPTETKASVQRPTESIASVQRPTESKASVQRPTETKASVQRPTESKASVQSPPDTTPDKDLVVEAKVSTSNTEAVNEISEAITDFIHVKDNERVEYSAIGGHTETSTVRVPDTQGLKPEQDIRPKTSVYPPVSPIEMDRSVDDILQEGKLACQDPAEKETAANCASLAWGKAKKEMTKLLQKRETCVDTQRLAVWFGDCAFIFHQIGHIEQALRAFYTATVFDGEWKRDEHMRVSDVLWGALVYLQPRERLQSRFSELNQLLTDMDNIAKMAERQERWLVCMTITNDVQRIFNFLCHRHGLGPRNITKSPLSLDGIQRSARCSFELKDHLSLRKLCQIIQTEFAECDDVKAYELTARSFQMTNEYNLALRDVNEAIRYCQDAEKLNDLRGLQNEIQQQLQEVESQDNQSVNEDWLEGTAAAVDDKTGSPCHVAGEQKKKKQHRRPKAKNPAPEIEDMRASFEAMKQDDEAVKKRKRNGTLNDSTAEGIDTETIIYRRDTTQSPPERTKRVRKGRRQVQELPLANGHARSRTCSRSSVSTGDIEVDSIYTCDITSVATLSDSDFSDDFSEMGNEEMFEMDEELTDVIGAGPDDDTSFYEKSCRLHLSDDCPEAVADELETESKTERLLKCGLKLNQSYLCRFDDHREDVMARDAFYDQVSYTKEQLEEMLLKEPARFKRCTLQIERAHMAYCTPKDSNDMISIIEISGRSKAGQTFDEDEVVVELLDTVHENKDKRYGKVVGILERQRHKDITHPVFICTLDDLESHLVRPMCKTLPKIHILNKHVLSDYPKLKKYKVEVYDYDEQTEELEFNKFIDITPANREKLIFLVGYIHWSAQHIYPRGAVIKVFPFGETLDRGLVVLNLQNEVPGLYKKKTVTQVEGMCRRQESDEPSQFELNGRRDFTSLKTFTIDPEGCCDIDDALSVEKVEGGYRVGVHIADVTTRVRKDDHVDIEARERASTFYPGIRKPRHMLPEPLSSKLCSLHQNRVRLTLSVMFYLNAHGKIMQKTGDSYEIVKSYISSRRQFTYAEAQKILSYTEEDDDLAADIRILAKLAKSIRYERLGNAMFAVDIDEMESLDESDSRCDEAHYLVEEFMIMANKKIARVLNRKFPQCVPLRCQQPPSKESMEEYVKRHDVMLDTLVFMQDKAICDYKTPSLESLLQQDRGDMIFVSKANWALISSEDVEASSRCIRTDNLHPLQHLIRQHWLQIQTQAFYKCASSNQTRNDNHHYSLDVDCYTHFTSPIRRYIDIVVHRLVHAYIDKAASPYKRKEIEDICIHASSRMRKAKKYQKGCKALQQALEFKQCQKTVLAYVDEISDRGLTLSSVSFKHVAKQFRELQFSLLNVSSKPDVVEDTRSVSVRWNRRLYDINLSSDPPDRGDVHKINPMKGIVALKLVDWARLLKCAVLDNSEDLRRAIRNVHITGSSSGKDDVSTECIDPWKIRPVTKFSLKYEFGHAVYVQMSADARQGILAPRPVLYNLSNNVKFCLDHMQDPVRYLYYYSTRATHERYQSIKEYINVWLPLVTMQAAVDAVKNDESFVINNIPLSFPGPRTGKFALYIDYCEIRNLDFSGTEIISDEAEEETNSIPQSYDWLCIKQISQATSDKTSSQKCLENVTVYHAEVVNVKKKKSEGRKRKGKLIVSFELHKESSSIPDSSRMIADGDLLKKQTHPTKDSSSKYSVEVIKKTETDRRTESILQQFSTLGSNLAKCIALNNKAFPKRNSDKKTGILTARDIDDYFHEMLPDIHKLPRNNPKQEEAINKAATSGFTLIQGPPGTGKTYTGVKLIFLFNKINQYAHEKLGQKKRAVLFCGPSNKSVDLVAKLLINRLDVECPKFVRVYGRSIEELDFPVPGRTFTYKKSKELKVGDVLKPVALHHVIRQKDKPYAEELRHYDNMFALKDYQIDSQSMFADIRNYLRLVREASIAEIKENDVILCTTAVGSNPKVLDGANVYQIIIDEAGMCTEPECLVPIVATKAEQVVLIGDHKQLRPIVTCSQAAGLGLDKSLFERYANLTASGECKNVEFTMLEVQYRMHPNICRFPSKMFYDRKLTTGRLPWNTFSKEDDFLLEIWPFDRHGIYPHVLVHVEGEEQILTVSTDEGNEMSRSNAAELEHVLKVYRYMIDQGISSTQINVVSQYNAQCAEIRKALAAEGYSNFIVTTVVSSQGGEWDYVIFSTVRSLPDYKIEHNPTLGWCKSNLGFITDRNQINVALTRAHKGLVIIGNQRLLNCDFVWKRLISHYEEHKCLKTPETFPPPRKTRQQIMEENILRNEIRYGDSMFERGTATSYDGNFDVDDEDLDSGLSWPFNRRGRGGGRGRGRGRGRGQFNGRFQGGRQSFGDNVVTDSDSD